MFGRKLASLFDYMEKPPHSKLELDTGVALPKKLSSKLFEILKIYRDKNHPEILRGLIEDVRIPDYDTYRIAEVNKTTPKVLESLFVDRYTDADFEDLGTVIERICTHIVERADFKDFILSVGMGGSIDIPNIRMAGYVMPAIRSLEKLHALSETNEISGCPRVKIFKANHMAILVNGFDTDRVLKVSKLSLTYLQRFIERFYPHLQDFIIFTEDKEITPVEIDYFREQTELLKTAESIRDDVQNVIRMGEKHSELQGESHNNSLLYAVAHPYYNQSIISRGINPLQETCDRPSVIVDYGGKPQVRFNRISRELMKLIENSERDSVVTPVVHLVIKPGRIPAYYAARDGDIPLGETISHIDYGKVDRATHTDYREIFSSIDESAFVDFVNEFNQTNGDLIDSLRP